MTAFREALIRHVKASSLTAGEISKRAKVSKYKIDKLMERKAESTKVEDAMKLCRFFGKSLEDFIDAPTDTQIMSVLDKLRQLDPAEIAVVDAQLTGLTAQRRPVKR